MARAEAGARLPVEVLVERDEVAPERIALESLHAAEHRATAVRPTQEDPREAARELHRDVPEIHAPARSRRARDLEPLAQEPVELLERLDEEVVHGEPDRATPVRVAAEERDRGLRRLVVHPVLHAVELEDIRMLAMIAGQGTDPVGREKLLLVQHVA